MEKKPAPLLIPDWPAPSNVKAWVTSREPVFARPSRDKTAFGAFNVADHVGDSPAAVAANREALKTKLEVSHIQWLEQVHGTGVIDIAGIADTALSQPPQADAIYCQQTGIACAILTADCLPVIFCSDDGKEIAVAHAGWRGLAAGVLQQTLKKFKVPPKHILAWLGPAIGPCHFQVGDEVKQTFTETTPELAACFTASIRKGQEKTPHWNADLFQLARTILLESGLTLISGGGVCTYCENQHFYSYRYNHERDQQSGRFATLISLS